MFQRQHSYSRRVFTAMTDEIQANTSFVILITGVGQRAGFHLANYFCNQGWTVFGTYRTQRPELVELEQKGCHLFQADYQDHQQVTEQISAIKKMLQDLNLSLRAIIHNASDWAKEDPNQPDADLLNAMMNIHVRVPYLFNQTLLECFGSEHSSHPEHPEHSHQKHRDIIHITDYVASTGSAKHIAYAASKAALENLTLSMAKSLAPSIKVNSIAPALLEFNEKDSDDYKTKALSKNLLPVTGGFDSLAKTIDYLMSNRYITGRSIPLDGGRHLA